MTDFAAKTAVVTGGASGIGESLAAELHARGARVFILDLDATAAEAAAAAIGCGWRRCDVADNESVAQAMDSINDEAGPVKIAVLNAGVGPFAPLAEMSQSDWSWMLGVNTWGVINCVNAVMPTLTLGEETGHVVIVSSMSALDPSPGLGAYAASKAAVTAIGESLSDELAQQGMPGAVTIAFPGPTRTNISSSQRGRQDSGGLIDRTLDDAAFDWVRWQNPSGVALSILDAAQQGELYVTTHPDLKHRFDRRMEQITAAFERAQARST